MNLYLFGLLRFIHIFSGTLWIGAAIVYLFFIKPSVKAIGPAGPQFMQALANRRKYPMYMMSVSLVTILAGSVTYLTSSGGFNLAWIQSGPGLGFTIGALAGLVAFLVGGLGIGPTSAKMGALGQEIAASGGPPTPKQLTSLQALEQRLSLAERIDFIMLVIAMVTMATARFWIF